MKINNISTLLKKMNFEIILLFIILAIAAYIRFLKITQIGMVGCDIFQYWEMGRLWLEGNYRLSETLTSAPFYRPAIYFLYSLALKIFGINDYAIKIFNSSLDIINIILIFFIVFFLTRNKWIGVFTSIIYAFLPKVIYHSRIELVHIPSATFLLSSLLFFIIFHNSLYKRNKSLRYISLVLSGFSLSIASNIHPDLSLLGLPYVCFIYFLIKQDRIEYLRLFLLYSFIFTISFFSLYIAGVIYYGYSTVLNILLYQQSTQNTPNELSSSFIQYFSTVFCRFFTENISKLSLILFLGIVPIIIYRKIKKMNDLILAYLPFIFILFYILEYSILFRTHLLPRLFIPFIPLVFISIIYLYYKLINTYLKKISVILILLLTLLILYNNSPISKLPNYKTTYIREVFNILKYKVDEKNKLLITPYIIYKQRRGFKYDMYFGKNVIYIYYTTDKIDKVVKNHDIRYIFVSNDGLDRRILNQDCEKTELVLGSAYGLSSSREYTLKKEYYLLNNFLIKNNARSLYKSGIGEIFELSL